MPDLSDPALPLAGLKVVEFCQVAAGPFCGMLLADLGAEVVKIENPEGGDSLRAWPPITGGYSENFASLNRNKRSLALDLKAPEHLARARKLCLEADAVIENLRPGVLARLGLGAEALRAEKPALVFASISAFGQEGPRAAEGGFDLTVQAIGGVMSVTGEPDGAPVKCGVPISDFAAGLYAAFALVAALRRAAATGEGCHVDASMLGATLGIAALQTSEYFGSGKVPKKLGAAHPRNAPYEAFKARDGYFAMAAGNDRLFASVCGVVEMPELLADPRFGSTSLRAQNQTALKALLEERFAAADCARWLEAFRAAGVPAAPINDYAAVLDDPQVRHMGWVEQMQLPGGAEIRTFGSPLRFDGKRPPIRRGPPALGEANDEVR